ncbi:ATP/GTP-binding protein [Streptomyces sp. SBST2-5]|uniref:ATP/GTP-binding protein n=1 Tax=Streptomyces composti TaxID=2720025 RepID=A0ABX1ABQ9_9ACTN|nr:ATP/GTP-binding protein [Streptomyces composti]NJP52851.1 ATP/GTP-binding protein [Streptomyces composti]
MDGDGTQDARGTRGRAVPDPAAPLPPVPRSSPAVPPQPQYEGQRTQPMASWLDTPRADAALGVWRFGYVPPRPKARERKLAPTTVAGALIPLVIGAFLWTLWARGSFPYQGALVRLFTPNDWWYGGSLWPRDGVWQAPVARKVADNVFFLLLVCAMGYLGGWPALIRYWFGRWEQPARAAVAAAGAAVALLLVYPFFDSDPVPVYTTMVLLVALITGGWEATDNPLIVLLIVSSIALAVLWPAARWGGWMPLLRRHRAARKAGPRPRAEPVAAKPSQWPALRTAGQTEAADALSAELLSGRMNDVDCARIHRSWETLRRAGRLASFTETVLRHGAAAWTHPSGARDLPRRTATHDLWAGQVRIGRWAAAERTPASHQGAGAALEPATLGTSLLAVGPPGSGRTDRLMIPVTESLTLHALTGACAVVAVGTAGAPLGPDAAYDVVVRPGDPASLRALDLYAESTDPDEAAAVLAEGLVGDIETLDTGRAATALAQLIGPYRAAYGAFPAVAALRELVEGREEALTALLDRLPDRDAPALRRELEPWLRRTGAAVTAGPALADRLALLDRPAFRGSFGGPEDGEAGQGAPDGTVRPFSLRAVAHHPLRVRIDLPEQGHEEAAHLLARLVLAQFLAVARAAGARDHFLGLVMDDASGAVTRGTVRAVQRLRSHDAGVVLGLRTLGDVPESLHGPLLSAVGCRAAFSGVTTWDGRAFAEAWGTEWVETTEVAQHTVFADQPMTRAMHALRKLVTGKAVTTEAVTVRQIERERWSASELAHGLPPGHAVLSLTDVRGEHAPPLLVDLRG